MSGLFNRAQNLHKEKDPAEALQEDLVYKNYRRGNTLLVQHVKPSGKVFQTRAKVQKFSGKRLVLLRTFRPGGTFDGLDLPKEPGDWGVLEIEEGAWHFRRRYFNKSGELKGEIYNINTPLEFLPGAIRYLDLELDIVLKTGGQPRLIDCFHLERMSRRNILSPSLVKKAWQNAFLLLQELQEQEQV